MKMKLTRRKILYALAGTSLIPGGVGYYTWRIEPHWIEIVHRDLPLPNLPTELENKTLVQISDLHVGPRVDSSYIIHSLQSIQELKPDLLAITGDFVTYRSPQEFEELSRVLEHIPQPTMGSFGVLGNHDYGPGWRYDKIADEVTKRVEAQGIKMLRNTSTELHGLNLVGVEDYWAPHFKTGEVTKAFPNQNPSLILCHNPDSADHVSFLNAKGYMLCGHTHGGQCKPPFLPPPILPVKNTRYSAGEFEIREGLKMYINRGLGYMIRVRINVRPEITVFTLKKLV